MVFGNGFVAHFGLGIALRVMTGCGSMVGLQMLVESFSEFDAKLFSLVCDNFLRYSVLTDPFLEDCLSDSFSFFVANGNQFDIFSKSVRNY